MEQLFSDFIVHLDATSDTDNHNYQGGQSEAFTAKFSIVFEQRGKKTNHSVRDEKRETN